MIEALFWRVADKPDVALQENNWPGEVLGWMYQRRELWKGQVG